MNDHITKYKLYRGVPYSGLDLDDLEGRGGYGQRMLGGGLYTTDDYYIAANYANEESAYYRDYSKNNTPCVYELELAIPERQILYLDGQHNMSFCHVDYIDGSAIPDIFGVSSPAFEFWFKDANTGEEFTYLISGYQDPLEYAESFKLKCANEVLSNHDLGKMDDFEDFDTYLEQLYCEDAEGDYEDEDHEFACEGLKTFLADEADGDIERAAEILEKEYLELIRENSGLPNYGRYDESPNIRWGGDSTDLTYIADKHGFKVLWCADWISSGDEVVIVDESIYDKGLTIVDNCE